jgi:hypothetical protein
MEGTGYVQILRIRSWRPKKLTDPLVPDPYQSLVLSLIVYSKLSLSVQSFKLVGNELVSDRNHYRLSRKIIPDLDRTWPKRSKYDRIRIRIHHTKRSFL